MFAPLVTQRRYQQIAEKIAEDIIAGRVNPGDRLPAERDLAQQFGVSRPTVREALIALEITGFVEIRVGLGVFVSLRAPGQTRLSPISGPGPFELIEARRLVEGEIVALAASMISDAAIKALENAIALMIEENKDNFSSYEGDKRFHLLIAESTKNSAFVDIVDYFWQQRSQAPMWVRLHERVSPADVRSKAVDEHREIVETLRDRSPDAARQAMHRHISRVTHTLLNRWNDLRGTEQLDPSAGQDEIVERLSPSSGPTA